MNVKVIAIAAAVVLLLGAGGLLFYNKANQPTSPTDTTASPTPQDSADNSLFDLLASGRNQECTFTYKGESQEETSGNFFITQAKMRGDITTKTNGKTSMFYIIRNGNDTYMWGSELTQGIKMTISEEELKSNEQASSYVDLKANYNYSCRDWNPDNSKFAPPSNVKFTDLSTMMQQTTTSSGSSIKLDASACASISDPGAKAACEQAIMGQ